MEDYKCDKCGKKATHIQKPDPFVEDIYGRINLVNLCDKCYKDAIDDI